MAERHSPRYLRARRILRRQFAVNECRREGHPQGPGTMKEWVEAWRMIGAISAAEYCRLMDRIETHFDR